MHIDIDMEISICGDVLNNDVAYLREQKVRFKESRQLLDDSFERRVERGGGGRRRVVDARLRAAVFQVLTRNVQKQLEEGTQGEGVYILTYIYI